MHTPQHPDAVELARVAKGLLLMAEGIDKGEIEVSHGAAALTQDASGVALTADIFLGYTAKGKAHMRRTNKRISAKK